MQALRQYWSDSGLWHIWVYRDHVHTILYDGSETKGYPLDTDKFKEDAFKAGYVTDGEPDVYWYMVEHDILHSWMAEAIDSAPSASIWNQAHNPKAYLQKANEVIWRDEKRVYAMQTVLNGDSSTWGVDYLKEQDIDPHLIGHASRMLRSDGRMTSKWAKDAPILTSTGKKPLFWGNNL